MAKRTKRDRFNAEREQRYPHSVIYRHGRHWAYQSSTGSKADAEALAAETSDCYGVHADVISRGPIAARREVDRRNNLPFAERFADFR